MVRRILATALAWSVLLLAVPAAAQEEAPEFGQLYEIFTWNVPPSVTPEWRRNAAKLVEAAEAANISDSWYMYSGASSFTLVYPIENYAALDDPMAFMRQFQGTEGEALFQEAMGALQKLDVRPGMAEIQERVDDWSYEPEGMEAPPSWAHVDDYWVMPGQQEAFGELAEEFVAFLEAIGYPYAVDAHRTHFGKVGRVTVVTFVDDLASFYGENDLRRLVEAAGAEAEWRALVERFAPLVYKIEQRNVRLEPELTYVGD